MTRVVDGDTLDVAAGDGRTVRVRLHAVDAPESNQPGGQAATHQVRTWIHETGGGSVKVIPTAVDQHGRTVARIEAGGVDLGRALVGECLVWVDKRFCGAYCRANYLPAAKTCRREKRGLWAGKKPIAPAAWRAGKRPR
ncbi:MAG TPA: thermonuclease family protein [Solidesulfovibrio magneticus]|nr:thermonuclease family protein [Solidesulfovibrio magneticus]